MRWGRARGPIKRRRNGDTGKGAQGNMQRLRRAVLRREGLPRRQDDSLSVHSLPIPSWQKAHIGEDYPNLLLVLHECPAFTCQEMPEQGMSISTLPYGKKPEKGRAGWAKMEFSGVKTSKRYPRQGKCKLREKTRYRRVKCRVHFASSARLNIDRRRTRSMLSKSHLGQSDFGAPTYGNAHPVGIR